MADEEIQPWERRDTETDDEWLAFREYRDTRDRVITKTLPANADVAKAMAVKHDWRARVIAYDRYLDQRAIEERESILKRNARAITEDHLVILSKQRDAVRKSVEKKLADIEAGVVEDLTLNDVVKATETQVKTDRLVIGEATDRVENNAVDYSRLSIEELETVTTLHRKVLKEGA